jgi:hypothetical protein
MNQQKIRAGGGRLLNGSERRIHRRCYPTDGAIILDLQAIQGLVGYVRDSEEGVEIAYNFAERNLRR